MRQIFLGLVIFSSAIAFARTPPSIEVVNQYISLALVLDSEQLKGKGKWYCSYPLEDMPYQAQGKNLEEAQTVLALQCIRDRCGKVNEILDKSIDKMRERSDEELREVYRGLGYSQDEIKAAIHNLRSGFKSNVDCVTGSDSVRFFSFDACFAPPMTCGKLRR